MERAASLLNVMDSYEVFAAFREAINSINRSPSTGPFVFEHSLKQLQQSTLWASLTASRAAKLPDYRARIPELQAEIDFLKSAEKEAVEQLYDFRKLRRYFFGHETEEQLNSRLARDERLRLQRK